MGNTLDEALTEISVEILLGREPEAFTYFEITVLAKQMGAVLGLTNKQLLKFYKKGGRKDLIKAFAVLTDEQAATDETRFESLEKFYDFLHTAHIEDLDKELEKYGEITKKPLGAFPSERTMTLRKYIQDDLSGILLQGYENGAISENTCQRRMLKVKKLSPY